MATRDTTYADRNEYSFKFDAEMESVYRKAFPSLVSVEVVTDRARQKKWIDKILTLASGKTVKIDDKIRERDYGDIAIEEWSNYERKNVGWWFDGELETDFVFYYIRKTKKCYVLNHKDLVAFMKKNYEELKTFRDYTTTTVYDERKYTTTFFKIPLRFFGANGFKVYEFVAD